MRQAGKHKTDGASNRDRHGDARRSGDRIVDRLTVDGEDDGRYRPTAHPHQRSKKTDAETIERHRQRARQLIAEVPAITGTITEPPETPNNPASTPEISPPMTRASA